jgi:hypothetical protein
MVIVALDHVPHCYSSQDGNTIRGLLQKAFAAGHSVQLSFAGVEDVPSSFINAALVPFVLENGVEWVKANLAITRARKQIIDMIRLCFANAERSLFAA